MTDDDVVTVGERYLVAATTKNLTQSLTKRCDADVLLAAAYATANDPRRTLALKAWRLGKAGDTEHLGEIVAELESWLAGWLSKGKRPMPRAARDALVVAVLRWWMNQTCTYCEGRAFVTVENTGRLSTVACDGCYGTGKRALRRAVEPAYFNAADWLVGELDRLLAVVHSDMSKVLSQKMELL